MKKIHSAFALTGLVAAFIFSGADKAEAQSVSSTPCSSRYQLAWEMPLRSSDVGQAPVNVMQRSEFSTTRNVSGDRSRIAIGRAPDGTVALQMNVRKGENRSVDFFLSPLGNKGVDAACLSFRVFMEPGFQWPTASGGGMKMGWGLWGGGSASKVSGGTPPNEQLGWSVRNVNTLYGFRHYSYHLNRSSRFGHQGTPLARWESSAWRSGRWHTIELEVVMNAPGQSNGYLQLWLDGGNRKTLTNLEFRRNSDWAIRGLMFSDIWGGTTSDPKNWSPKAQKMWYADYKLYTGNGRAVSQSQSTPSTSTSTVSSTPTSTTKPISSGDAFGPVAPSGTVSGSNMVANWNPDPKADRYYVRVMTWAARWADRKDMFGGSAFSSRHCNSAGCSLGVGSLPPGNYEWFVRTHEATTADYKSMTFSVR